MVQNPSSHLGRPDHVLPEPPPVGAPGHDEAVIDEAIKQTFPASDPPAVSMPGSSINRSNASERRKAGADEDDPSQAVEF